MQNLVVPNKKDHFDADDHLQSANAKSTFFDSNFGLTTAGMYWLGCQPFSIIVL
jgi:hypothetical protein